MRQKQTGLSVSYRPCHVPWPDLPDATIVCFSSLFCLDVCAVFHLSIPTHFVVLAYHFVFIAYRLFSLVHVACGVSIRVPVCWTNAIVETKREPHERTVTCLKTPTTLFIWADGDLLSWFPQGSAIFAHNVPPYFSLSFGVASYRQ